MPTSDITVIDYWRRSAEVDYFSHYIKAYLAFNALMRLRDPESKRDRELIDSIKNFGGRIKSEFDRSLNSRAAESQLFLSHLGQLHSYLERAVIVANDNEGAISFTRIRLNEEAPELETTESRGVKYSVKREAKRIEILVTYQSNEILNIKQNKYSLLEIISHEKYVNLTDTRKEVLRSCYVKFDPKTVSNIIISEGGIETPSCRFDGTSDRLYKSVIEILYSLRCALFHGRLVPSDDNAKVYEFAYLILRKLIHSQ